MWLLKKLHMPVNCLNSLAVLGIAVFLDALKFVYTWQNSFWSESEAKVLGISSLKLTFWQFSFKAHLSQPCKKNLSWFELSS
jgi:hypothetical protein